MCNQAAISSSGKALAPCTVKVASAWCDRDQLLISAGHWSSDRETARFPVWEVELPLDLCAQRIPEKLHFQKGYPKAEAVWADTPLGAQIRSDVHRENSAMFGSCHDKVTVTGSSEFLSAMGFGFREGKAQVYAFVITTDGRLRFCEAAAEVMHISMSDASEDILFAGEFFIAHEAGRYFMIVSNNSGSYRPDKVMLENTRQLFADILADVDVEACLMDDPRIKQLTARHRGDPLHMGHSIHHPELHEQRSAAQLKSALVIMGRGHEVGVYGYGNVPQPRIRAQSPRPQQMTMGPIAGHRRSRTWGTSPALVGGTEEPATQASSSVAPAHQHVLEHRTCTSGQYNAYASGQTVNRCASSNSTSQSSPVYPDPFATAPSASPVYPDPFATAPSAQQIQGTQQRAIISTTSRQMAPSCPAMVNRLPSAHIQRIMTCQ